MKRGHVTGAKKEKGKAKGYPSWMVEEITATIKRLREAEGTK